MNARVAILVIGSLMWDQKPHRQQWRDARLRVCNRVHLTVPIRYGRKSSTRGDTYTMVFSQLMCYPEKMGMGIAIPCARRIRCTSDLIEEAKALWAAEQPPKNDTHDAISAKWGCVGIVPNPKYSQRHVVVGEWLDEYKKNKHNRYPQLETACGEEPILGNGGILNIPWPQTEMGEYYDGADILLATATAPTICDGKYPSPKEIAQAWKADTNKYICYFRKNRMYGIVTSEDEQIEEVLKNLDNLPN